MSEENNRKRSLDSVATQGECGEVISSKRLKQSEVQWNETIDEIAEIFSSKLFLKRKY